MSSTETSPSSRIIPASAVTAMAHTRAMASSHVIEVPVLKIATFHSSSLGSLVASLPALVTLRDSFPGARICSFAKAPLLPLLENFSAVDEAHARPGGGISSQAALMARLHGGDFNLAISFSQGSNALLLMWATGAPIRAGFVPSRMDALLTHKTHKNGTMRPLDALELARSVGATPRGEIAREWLQIPFHIQNHSDELLKEGGIERDYIVVSTEQRKAGKASEELPAVNAEMLSRLSARFPVVLVGLKSVRPLLRSIGDTVHPILDLGGKTDALTLASLCQTSRGIFAEGNGVLQIGKLFDKPTVAMSDSDDPVTRALQIFGF